MSIFVCLRTFLSFSSVSEQTFLSRSESWQRPFNLENLITAEAKCCFLRILQNHSNRIYCFAPSREEKLHENLIRNCNLLHPALSEKRFCPRFFGKHKTSTRRTLIIGFPAKNCVLHSLFVVVDGLYFNFLTLNGEEKFS